MKPIKTLEDAFGVKGAWIVFSLNIANILMFSALLVGLVAIGITKQEYCTPLLVNVFKFTDTGSDLIVGPSTSDLGCFKLEWLLGASALLSLAKHIAVLIWFPAYIRTSMRGFFVFDLAEYVLNSVPPVLALLWITGSIDFVLTVLLALDLAVVNLGGIFLHYHVAYKRPRSWGLVWSFFLILSLFSLKIWFAAGTVFTLSNFASTEAAPLFVWMIFFGLAPLYYAFGVVSGVDLAARWGASWAQRILHWAPLFGAINFMILGIAAKGYLIVNFEWGTLTRTIA